MPILSVDDVTRAAYDAGFRGDNLVTAVAIAGAESGGYNSDAHCLNCFPGVKEDSRGLWQINVLAHPQYAGWNLYDPAQNAKAAFEVAGGGKRFTPWTAYTHSTYARYVGVASAAALSLKNSGYTGAGGAATGTGGNIVTDAAGAAVGAVSSVAGAATDAAGKGLDWLTGGAVTAVKTVGDAAMVFARFLGLVANPDTWRRFGLILAGVAVAGLGFALINRDTFAGMAKDAVKSAGEAALAA